MRRVTQSEMMATLGCEERARLRYQEKMSTGTSRAMTRGSACHQGFEYQSVVAALEYLHKHYGEAWTEEEQRELLLDRAIVGGIVDGGLENWDVWPSQTEVEFNVPFTNPATGRRSTRHSFAGKIDGIFLPGEWRGNTVPVLMEIKTSSRLDSTYLEKLAMAWQPTSYMAGASLMFGVPIREMVYRIARTPSIRPKKKVARKAAEPNGGPTHYSPETSSEYAARVIADYKERPDFYFEELVVTRTDAQIERWWYEAWELHQRILRIENGGMTVRNPNQCFQYGRSCSFFDLCRGVVGPEAYPVLQDLHPELDGTTNEQTSVNLAPSTP